jgi:hypothetical protein
MSESILDAVFTLKKTIEELKLPIILAPAEPEKINTLRKELDLPVDLVTWYSLAGSNSFEIPTPNPGNNPIFLNLEQLDKALAGYSYNAITKEKLDVWDSSWLVIGGEDEYPIIVRKGDTRDNATYFAEPSLFGWNLYILSTNLGGFLHGIAQYLRLYLNEYQGAIWDKNYVLNPKFMADFSKSLDRHPATEGRVETWLVKWLGY